MIKTKLRSSIISCISIFLYSIRIRREQKLQRSIHDDDDDSLLRISIFAAKSNSCSQSQLTVQYCCALKTCVYQLFGAAHRFTSTNAESVRKSIQTWFSNRFWVHYKTRCQHERSRNQQGPSENGRRSKYCDTNIYGRLRCHRITIGCGRSASGSGHPDRRTIAWTTVAVLQTRRIQEQTTARCHPRGA